MSGSRSVSSVPPPLAAQPAGKLLADGVDGLAGVAEGIADALGVEGDSLATVGARVDGIVAARGTRPRPTMRSNSPERTQAISSWVRLTGIGWVTPRSSISRVRRSRPPPSSV